MKGHKDEIRKIKFNVTVELLATASDDETCCVWQVSIGLMVKKVRCQCWVSSLIWKDKETVIAGCSDGRIKLWRVELDQDKFATRWTKWSERTKARQEGVDKVTLEGHTTGVCILEFQPSKSILASCSWDERVIIWILGLSACQLHVLKGHRGSVMELKFSPSEPHFLVIWDSSSDVRLFDPVEGNCIHVFQCRPNPSANSVHPSYPSYASYGWFEKNNLLFSPNGRLIACRGETIKMFNVETRKIAAIYRVKSKMMCWSNNSDKFSIVTEYSVTTYDV